LEEVTRFHDTVCNDLIDSGHYDKYRYDMTSIPKGTPSPIRPSPSAPPPCERVASAADPSPWTPDREARAVRLYLQEGLTAAEVAEALGADVSRAAVIGKIRRLGFGKRKSRAAVGEDVVTVRSPVTSRARVERRLPPPRPPMPLPPLREIGPTGAPGPLACLPAGACRWPIDDPGPGRMHLTLFCAGHAEDGVYCAAHRALSSNRPSAACSPPSSSRSVS
jgi:GcrA cell cycle regulator